MPAKEVLIEFLKGEHTLGQMLNLFKYRCGKKQSVVNWDPIFITTYLTTRCNLSCDMCLTHSREFSNRYGQKPIKDMDFDLFKQILNRYKNAIKVYLIGNGEPLLNKDLFRMIEYASTVMKMNVDVSSNGIILREYIEEILNSPLKYFNVSVNGHNPEEFNRMTGMPPELFDVISNNTAELVKQKQAKGAKLKVSISIILDQGNYRDLNDMICFAENLGVDEVTFFHFLPSPAKGYTAEERCLFSDDSDVVEVFSAANSVRSRIRTTVMLPPLLEREMTSNKYCCLPFNSITVDGEGNVGGCSCQLLDNTGNGKFYDKDVWNNGYFQEMRKRFMDPEFPLLEPCTWCYSNSGYKLSNRRHNLLSRIARWIPQGLQK